MEGTIGCSKVLVFNSNVVFSSVSKTQRFRGNQLRWYYHHHHPHPRYQLKLVASSEIPPGFISYHQSTKTDEQQLNLNLVPSPPTHIIIPKPKPKYKVLGHVLFGGVILSVLGTVLIQSVLIPKQALLGCEHKMVMNMNMNMNCCGVPEIICSYYKAEEFFIFRLILALFTIGLAIIHEFYAENTRKFVTTFTFKLVWVMLIGGFVASSLLLLSTATVMDSSLLSSPPFHLVVALLFILFNACGLGMSVIQDIRQIDYRSWKKSKRLQKKYSRRGTKMRNKDFGKITPVEVFSLEADPSHN